jgi:hypothetical protein
MIRVLLVLLGLWLVWILIADYQVRMIEYNAHVCSVYGKQPDCKTPIR